MNGGPLPYVSRETHAALETFIELLRRWQTVKNLVGPATLDEVWTRHIADSLQLRDFAPDALRWLDLGSGAGLPGLVLAIAGREQPGFTVDLVESNARKCAFLREAARLTGAPARIHNARIEDVLGRLDPPEVVCARALAPLDQLLDWTEPLLRRGITALFPKGREVESELTLARARWTFAAEMIPSRTDSTGRIVRITAPISRTS